MKKGWSTRAALAILALATSGASFAAPVNFVITNARIVDGTGAPARSGALRVSGGKIAAIGALTPVPGEQVFDAHGLVLAPGFIDPHSHHDLKLDKFPDAVGATSQGITTIVVGNDGDSRAPLAKVFADLAKSPAALNLASYTGHGTIRAAVMGKDYKRHARPLEIRAMQRLLSADMRSGSLGLSTGLEYDPGIYSAPSEVVELARTAARSGGRYISHMRSEDVGLDAAIGEVIDIGRKARLPVQISHFKLAIVDRWGQAADFLARLDRARAEGIDISADVYPYEYWQANLTVLFPKRDFSDLAASEYALAHMAKPEGIILTSYAADPSLVGKTLADVARMRGKPAAQVYLDLINASPSKGENDVMIASSMTKGDIADLIAWPHSSICSDGELMGEHPRGAGSFPKVLAWLVRGEKRLSLETAIHKMSGLTAKHMGFADRGTLEPGKAADLVLLDPSTVADRATIADPHALAVGIESVWVNGEQVIAGGKATAARPGVIIRRQARAGR